MIPTFVMIAMFATGADKSPPDLPELCTVPGPYFKIPCKVDALKNVERVQLYMSDNRGEKWILYSQCTPDQPWFTFRAKQPGEYWFTARLKMKDGTLNPPNLADFVPMQRVAVIHGTDPPACPMTMRKGESTLAATATELDEELTRLELDLIRKEIKRLTEEARLTPDVEQKIDRLRNRLSEVRIRLRDQQGKLDVIVPPPSYQNLPPPNLNRRWLDDVPPAPPVPTPPKLPPSPFSSQRPVDLIPPTALPNE